MQSLDLYVVTLFLMHIVETSILVAFTLKALLHKQRISKLFFGKALFLTTLSLFLMYLSPLVALLIPIAILHIWLQTVFPLGILLVVLFIIRLVIIDRKGFSDYFGDRSLFIAVIVLIIMYLEAIIFNLDGYPTFIILLRILFPLR